MDKTAAAALLARHRVLDEIEAKAKGLGTIVGFVRKDVSTSMAMLQQELRSAVEEIVGSSDATEMLKWRLTQLVELKKKGVASMLEDVEEKVTAIQDGHRRIRGVLMYRPLAAAPSVTPPTVAAPSITPPTVATAPSITPPTVVPAPSVTPPTVAAAPTTGEETEGPKRGAQDEGGDGDGEDAKRPRPDKPPHPSAFLTAGAHPPVAYTCQRGRGHRYKKGVCTELDAFLASFKTYLETDHRSSYTKERLRGSTIHSRILNVRRIAMDYNITTFTTEKVDALMKRCLLNENQFTALKDIKHFLSWEQSKPSAAAEAAAPMVTAPDAKAAEAAEVSPVAAQAAPEGNEQKNECSVM